MNSTDELDTPRALLAGLRIPKVGAASCYPDDDPILRFDPAFGVGSDGGFYLNAQRHEADLRAFDGVKLFVGVGINLCASLRDGLREFLDRREPRVLGSDGVVYIKCTTRGGIMSAMSVRMPMFWGYLANDEETEHLLRKVMIMAGELAGRLPGGLQEVLRMNRDARQVMAQETPEPKVS